MPDGMNARDMLRQQTRDSEYGMGVYDLCVFFHDHTLLREGHDPFEVALQFLDARSQEEMDETDTGDGDKGV